MTDDVPSLLQWNDDNLLPNSRPAMVNRFNRLYKQWSEENDMKFTAIVVADIEGHIVNSRNSDREIVTLKYGARIWNPQAIRSKTGKLRFQFEFDPEDQYFICRFRGISPFRRFWTGVQVAYDSITNLTNVGVDFEDVIRQIESLDSDEGRTKRSMEREERSQLAYLQELSDVIVQPEWGSW